jgi:hypothetical protein
MLLALLLLAVALINVPFGYWRSGVRKFSRPWFLHVHGSIPLVVALRLMAGIHWTIVVGLMLASSYFLGQTIGARLRS